MQQGRDLHGMAAQKGEIVMRRQRIAAQDAEIINPHHGGRIGRALGMDPAHCNAHVGFLYSFGCSLACAAQRNQSLFIFWPRAAAAKAGGHGKTLSSVPSRLGNRSRVQRVSPS